MKYGAVHRGAGEGRKPPDCQFRTEGRVLAARMPEHELRLGCSLCALERVDLSALPFPYL